MMEYEIFKGVVGEKFKEFLPEKYQDAQVEIRPVDKVNRTLDGLSIRVNEPGMNISPTIYVNHMYEDYVTTENLNATLERAAEGFIKAMEQKESINVSELTNAECAKDKIVFQLINTEQNKEMLANMPHREFKDLGESAESIIAQQEEKGFIELEKLDFLQIISKLEGMLDITTGWLEHNDYRINLNKLCDRVNEILN